MPRRSGSDADAEREKAADRLRASALDGIKDKNEATLFSMADSNLNEAIESYRHGRLQAALVMARSAIDAALFASGHSRMTNGSIEIEAGSTKGEDSWASLREQAELLGFSERDIGAIRRMRIFGSLAVHAGSRFNRSMKELLELQEQERRRVIEGKGMFTNEAKVYEILEQAVKYLTEIRKRTMGGLKGESMGAGTGITMNVQPMAGRGRREAHEYIDGLIERGGSLKVLSPVIDLHYSSKIAEAARSGRNIQVITTYKSALKALRPGRLHGWPFGIAGVLLFFFGFPFLFFSWIGRLFILIGIVLAITALALHYIPEQEFQNLHVRVDRNIPGRVKLLIGEDEALAFSCDLTEESTHDRAEHLEVVKDRRSMVKLAAQFNALWKEVPEKRPLLVRSRQPVRTFRRRRWQRNL